VLGRGEGAARRHQALDRGIVGQVEEDHGPLLGARAFEGREVVIRLAEGNTHGGEHDRERLARGNASLTDDLRRQDVGGKAGAREDGELLAADQAVEAVDGRDPGLDELRGPLAADRVDRGTRDPAVVVAELGELRRIDIPALFDDLAELGVRVGTELESAARLPHSLAFELEAGEQVLGVECRDPNLHLSPPTTW
jgi:hypothetical protein